MAYNIEKATIHDAGQIHKLINSFASKGEMLPRSLSEIYENVRDYFVVRQKEKVIACAALHVSWEDLAEIKSLAVTREHQREGIGEQIVAACLEEAAGLGIATTFCLTYAPDFFAKCGFVLVEKKELPHKIWGECYRCPKFPDCDESALVYRTLREDCIAEETLSSEVVYKGRILNLRIDEVRLPDGSRSKREIVEHGDAVAIVAVDNNDNILLVKQYRQAAGKDLLEIPAGCVDPGEEPDTTVIREMQEETGYRPNVIKKLGGFYSAPGFSTEFLHLYLATELVPGRLYAEDTDGIELLKVTLDEAEGLIDSGDICDAKSIAGLLYYMKYRQSA